MVRFANALSEPANRAALAFRAHFEASRPEGVVETATSLTSVYVRFRPDRLLRADLELVLRGLLSDRKWSTEALPEGRRLWRVPASFGGRFGPDLDEVAELAGLDAETAIGEICAARLRVLALGFAPGQPYMGFLEPHWDIPRRSDLTPEVPQGAVVAAVQQINLFAHAAPTGWRQVGQTAFRPHDPGAAAEIPLRPGDEVQFCAIEPHELERLLSEAPPFGGARREAIG